MTREEIFLAINQACADLDAIATELLAGSERPGESIGEIIDRLNDVESALIELDA